MTSPSPGLSFPFCKLHVRVMVKHKGDTQNIGAEQIVRAVTVLMAAAPTELVARHSTPLWAYTVFFILHFMMALGHPQAHGCAG